MRTRFDQFGKQMVREALAGSCSVETDAEVPAVPTDPAKQTSDDQEFLMDTEDIYEKWRRAAIQEGWQQGLEEGVKQGLEEGVKQGLEEGVKQGLEEGVERERKLLLRLLRRRFGSQVGAETERRLGAASAEQIEIWAERVLSAGSLAEVLAD